MEERHLHDSVVAAIPDHPQSHSQRNRGNFAKLLILSINDNNVSGRSHHNSPGRSSDRRNTRRRHRRPPPPPRSCPIPPALRIRKYDDGSQSLALCLSEING